jgi:DUF1009 family protein
MIGLIFGETNFPKEVLKKVKSRKIKYLIIDLTKKNFFKNNKFSHKVSIGQFGKIIKILNKYKCNKVLFAGKVIKPNFSKLRLDIKGIYYLPRIIKTSKLGDAALLKEVINILNKEKITTVSSLTFSPELSTKRGNYSVIKPNRKDDLDIKKAIKTLNNLGKYDFSQGIVVRDRKVLAIEGNGGTAKMLNNFKSKNYIKTGVLVKFPKEKQDLRIDLPTIGLKTLLQCKSAGLKGVVLKSNKNVFLEKVKCVEYANKNKMFIVVK